jgi:type I restriction-modification system DNA methylase subunit
VFPITLFRGLSTTFIGSMLMGSVTKATRRLFKLDCRKHTDYVDAPGFCRAVKLEEIQKHDYVLTPGRYVGAEEGEDDDEAFADKMRRLTAQPDEQFTESARLEAEIRKNMQRLGFEVKI